jgi:polyhydroxyalkanoate synthesis regulator phasin
MSSQQSGGTGGGGGIRSVGEGLRAGIGILTAFKEAIEETIEEAVSRGDLRPDRAKAALGAAMDRAQDTVSDVRERLDMVPRRDFEALQAEVAELRRRLDRLESSSRAPGGPTLDADIVDEGGGV